MPKVPTRSATHQDLDYARLSALGLDLEEIADGEYLDLPAVVELAEDQGKPVSHFLAAIPLATDLKLRVDGAVAVKVCTGSCQKWGALDLVEHLVLRKIGLVPVSCLDRCDQAAACEVSGPGGTLVVDAATPAKLDEAVAAVCD